MKYDAWKRLCPEAVTDAEQVNHAAVNAETVALANQAGWSC